MPRHSTTKMPSATAMLVVLTLAVALMLAGAPARVIASDQAEGLPTPDDVVATVKAATGYALRTQNADGSWGGFQNPAVGIDDFWSNIETHRAWTIATTGLVCMAILDMTPTAETDAAYERGIDYLLEQGIVKRPSDWDTDNTWAYVYGVHAFARAVADGRFKGTERHDKLVSLGQQLIDHLFTYQTPSGGWGYYDFDAVARRPAWATSFMTAAAVIGLIEARDAGFRIDEKGLAAAVRAVERCKLPNGAYSYSVMAIPNTGRLTGINQIKGSLSRIQVCNVALLMAGKEITVETLKTGLDRFFEHHRFLDVARKKPIPHEAFYANSGYFYFFGHFYAGMVIQRLPVEDRARYWPRLQHHIVKTQEKDGSMWDYYMNSYHRPYGVAFSVMALRASLSTDVPPERTDDATLVAPTGDDRAAP